MNMHPQFRDHQSLLTRIDILEEENRQLRDQLAKVTGRNDTMVARQLFGLTESEARIFMLLLRCGEAEYGLMQDAVYSDGRLEEIEDPQWAIRAHMKRLRPKTRPFGIDFETVYSFGFRMSDAARATARRLLGGGHMPHLTPRTQEMLSYFTGLAPVGNSFEVPRRQVAADLGFRCVSIFHHYLNQLIASGRVRRIARASGGSTGVLVVLQRLEDA